MRTCLQAAQGAQYAAGGAVPRLITKDVALLRLFATPLSADADGYDSYGYSKEGYGKDGYDRSGYDK